MAEPTVKLLEKKVTKWKNVTCDTESEKVW